MNNNGVYQKKIQDLTTFTKTIILTRIAIDLYAFTGIATTMIEKVFVGIIVIILGMANYVIADSNAIYEGAHNYDYVSFGKILMLCSAAFTGIALWLFFMDLSQSYSQQAIKDHPSVRVAQSNYDSALKELERIRGGHSYTQEQLDTAVAKKAQIDLEIEKAQTAFEKVNQQAIAAHQAKVAAFWDKKTDGLKMSQIMTKDCVPLASPFGNGPMKSAAEKACPDWKKLQESSPTFIANGSPVVQSLGEQRKELIPIVDLVARLQKAETFVNSTKSVLLMVQEKLSTQEIYPSLFMRLPELTKGYVTPLGGVTFFFVCILVVLIGLPVYLTRSIVFLRMQMATGNTVQNVTERPREPSLLSRIFGLAKERTHEYLDKKTAKKQPVVVPSPVQDVPMAVVKKTDIQPSDIQKTSVQTVESVDMPSFKQVVTDNQSTENVQSIPTSKDVDTVYQMVLRAEKNEPLEKFSIPYLIDRFGIPHTTAAKVRDRLVRDGHAVYDEKKRCIPIRPLTKQRVPLNGQPGMF